MNENLKLWWVCKWEEFYPKGELRNVVGTFYTLDEAQTFVDKLKRGDVYMYGESEFYKCTIVNVSKMLGIENDALKLAPYWPDLYWE